MNMGSNVLRRRTWLVLGLTLCAALWVTAWPRWSMAQNEKGAAADEKPVAADEKQPAAEKPAAAAEKPAVAAEKPAGAPETKPVERSFLSWVVYCSGLIGLIILLLSIYFVSTVGRLFWEMRVEVAAPPELIAQCETLLEQRDFKGIYGLVREDDCRARHARAHDRFVGHAQGDDLQF
jgi:hypothetical protein